MRQKENNKEGFYKNGVFVKVVMGLLALGIFYLWGGF